MSQVSWVVINKRAIPVIVSKMYSMYLISSSHYFHQSSYFFEIFVEGIMGNQYFFQILASNEDV